MSNPSADEAGTPEQDQLNLQRELRAQMATVTGGLAPDVYVNAWFDWLLNLAKEPPQQLKLAEDAMKQTRLLVNNPRPLTFEDAYAIYSAAYDDSSNRSVRAANE